MNYTCSTSTGHTGHAQHCIGCYHGLVFLGNGSPLMYDRVDMADGATALRASDPGKLKSLFLSIASEVSYRWGIRLVVIYDDTGVKMEADDYMYEIRFLKNIPVGSSWYGSVQRLAVDICSVQTFNKNIWTKPGQCD